MAARKIAVLGAGEMGHGIAELAAIHGFEVAMRDIRQDFVDRGMDRIRWSLDKLVEHNQLTRGRADDVLGRIHPTLDLGTALRGADVVIEAILEDLELKKKVFAEVDALAPPHAMFASNTSALSITAMGRATNRKDRVVGMHFFNPPVMMQLVEVVRGDDTSDATVREAEDLSRALGKTPIVCRKDVPGFITTRTISEFPTDEAYLQWALQTTSLGNVRTKTLKAWSEPTPRR